MPAIKSTTPTLLLIFYQEWLLPRRKEWGPLSTAAVHAGFQVIVATWETLTVKDRMVQAGEALVLRPDSTDFETEPDITFNPAVVMTTWGTAGFHELFNRIISLGAYSSDYALINYLDGKCELEDCLRNYERNTGHAVSRPTTMLWNELLQNGAGPFHDDYVIMKPSHSGQCRGIEIVPNASLQKYAQEVEKGERAPFVAQKLVDNVFFYNQKRWDIRINVLATSLSPLRYHLYQQGIAKTAGVAAKTGSVALGEWLNAESFLAGQQVAENLSMTAMLDYVAREYMPLEDFWSQVDEVVGQVFSAIALQAEEQGIPLGRSFIYPGFDFIIEREDTAGYKVRLLEINSHPGLGWEPQITAELASQYRNWFAELMQMVQSPDELLAGSPEL